MSNTLADPDGGDHPAATVPFGEPHDRRAASPGEIAAFTTFYRQAAPKLVAFLRWHGASLPEAADCVQEALDEALTTLAAAVLTLQKRVAPRVSAWALIGQITRGRLLARPVPVAPS